MSKTINLKDWEAKGIAEKKVSLLVRVLNIDNEYELMDWQPNDKYFGFSYPIYFFGNADIGYTDIKKKYQPGDTLMCKESWAIKEKDNCIGSETGKCPNTSCGNIYNEFACFSEEIVYKADGVDYRLLSYKSPVRMPPEAVRFKLTVKAVWVKRLQELTNWETIKMGIQMPCHKCSVIEKYSECDFLKTSCKDKLIKQWNHDHRNNKYNKYESNPWVYGVEVEVL